MLQNPGMIRPPGDVGRKHKPACAISTPRKQQLREYRIERDFVMGSFGFYFADAPADNALLNQNQACGKVDMLPAQSQDFGNP